MKDSHDQSYYEIALTNRQVMSIFVVLLGCVLAAFLGGVWLGRGAEAGVGTVESASTQEISAGVEASDEPLEELDFFRKRDDSGAPVAAAAEEAAVSADASEDSATGQASKATDAGPIVIEEQTEVLPENEPELEPATEPSVETVSPAVARPAGPAPEAEEKGALPRIGGSVPDFVLIQVFSSTDEAQARRMVDRLRAGGYPALLSPVEVEGRTLHRVRIGPYTDLDEAEVIAGRVRSAFDLDTWITH